MEHKSRRIASGLTATPSSSYHFHLVLALALPFIVAYTPSPQPNLHEHAEAHGSSDDRRDDHHGAASIALRMRSIARPSITIECVNRSTVQPRIAASASFSQSF